MPSSEHEARVTLVKNDPGLTPKLLRSLLGVVLPAFAETDIQSADLSQLKPTEYRADSVVALRDARGRPSAAVVVEVQRTCDPKKRYSWPVYLTTLRERMECPTWLVVLACNRRTEAWAKAPIEMGHRDWVLRPLVVGPDDIPLITDAAVAADQPGLAVLSALTHHDHPLRDAVLRALRDGVSGIEGKEGEMYIDIALTGLPDLAQKHLEALMSADTYEFKSDFFRRLEAKSLAEGEAKGRAEGEVKSKANDIIAVLTTRGLKVSQRARKRIHDSTNVNQLSDWLVRAVTVPQADDLFG